MASAILPPEPSKFTFRDVPVFRCATCARETLSGACGCAEPKPLEAGSIAYGIPKEPVTT
jgi:hypothetical protein